MSTTPLRRPFLSRRARWAAPVVAAAAVAAAVGVPLVSADASPTLPAKTAGQLLAGLSGVQPRPFSGTVVETTRLGLPALPEQASSTSPLALLTGSHTVRVWYGGKQQVRLALVGDLAESDVVQNGSNVWLWSSQDKTATHYLLPASSGGADAGSATPDQVSRLTPQQAADQALAAIDPSTVVTVDGTARVAGRSAYELVLRPKDTRSLVGSVRLAVDAKTMIPLRVQVFAKGGTKPAFETGFTSVTFSRQPASVFRFTAPPGTKVTTKDMSAGSAHAKPGLDGSAKDGSRALPGKGTGEPKVIGTGWTSIVELTDVDLSRVSPVAKSGRALREDTTATLLKALTPVSGSFGHGRLLKTTLVSVLMLDDGRVFVGAVQPALLEAAAASTS